jgi:hypothetical protein
MTHYYEYIIEKCTSTKMTMVRKTNIPMEFFGGLWNLYHIFLRGAGAHFMSTKLLRAAHRR